MSASNVIEFPVGFSERRKARTPTAPHTDLGVPVDIAVWIHDLIIDGLNSGEFDECEGGPSGALAQFLQDKHGGDIAAAAEGCFELIYGCDPYTFLMHVAKQGSSKTRQG